MSKDYTLDHAKRAYAQSDAIPDDAEERSQLRERFDIALAAHDREVREAVIEDVAEMVEATFGDRLSNDDWTARIRALKKEEAS